MSDSTTAMRELSNKQIDSATAFLNKLSAAYVAGNRVVLTRTREPFRLIEVLRDYTFATNNHYRHWDVVNGWTQYVDADNSAKSSNEDKRVPETDGMTDILAAMHIIHASAPDKNNKAANPKGYTEVFPNGIYLMMNPHFAVGDNPNKSPRCLQCIKQYAVSFPYAQKMLILAVPHDYKTPVEIEDDVAVIDFDLPSVNERFNSIVDTLMDLFENEIEKESGAEYATFDFWAEVLNASSGLTLKSFQDYFTDAVIVTTASKRGKSKGAKVYLADLDPAEIAKMVNKAKTEIIKRSDILEIMESESMSNVGGQDLLKEWISRRKNAFSKEAREFGVDAPRGIMLVGPPGTGKSVAAKAISNVLGIPLIRFDVSRVFNSLVGASEQRIRSALKLVDALEPCVLFIDEIDKVFQSSGAGNDSGISSRVLGTLLTWMQETKSQVFVVMTANRTANLPPELLRKGRLDEIFSVTTPSKEELVEIAKIHFRKRGHGEDDIDYQSIAEAADGYVPAELESAIKESLLHAFNDDTDVSSVLVVEELKKMVPLSKAFESDFKEMENWAKNNARPSSSKERVDVISSMKHVEGVTSGKRRRRVGNVVEADDGLDISSH